jgi:hypothetical protein
VGDFVVSGIASFLDLPATGMDNYGSKGLYLFLRHCARYRALSRRIYPRGVFKFRSLAEAQAARAARPTASEPRR